MNEREVSHLGQPVLAVGEKSFVVLALGEHFPATEAIVLPTPYYYQKPLLPGLNLHVECLLKEGSCHGSAKNCRYLSVTRRVLKKMMSTNSFSCLHF